MRVRKSSAGFLCCAALSLLGSGASAQSNFDALPSLSLSPLGHNASELPPSLLKSGPTESSPAAAAGGLSQLQLRLSRTNGMPLLMQMPQEEIPGQYVRPKYALGFRSETMRQWAKGIGLDADTCYAPIMRGRTKLSQEGGLSGSLTMQARCSFR